jgi:hypothetical protein
MSHRNMIPSRLSQSLIAAFLLLLVSALGARAQPIAALLPPEAAALLASSGKAVRSGSSAPAFLPLHPSSAAIRDAIGAEKPSVLVEAVFALHGAKPASPAARSAELASIYGILRSLGSLEGIEYYSASRKTMRTFYAESYVIAGPESKARMPDPKAPAPGNLPAAETLYAFQRDLSFGANTYQYDYASYPDALILKSTNLTRMSYGLVPVMAPKALATRLLIVQADDGILFYAESGASAPGIFKGKLEDSFSNRAEALFRWFSVKYSGLAKL